MCFHFDFFKSIQSQLRENNHGKKGILEIFSSLACKRFEKLISHGGLLLCSKV